MNKLIHLLALASIFASCGVKKPIHSFQRTTVYQLVEERTRQTRLRNWRAEIYHEPLASSNFVYRNYDIYFVFHSEGRLSRVLVPKDSEWTKSKLFKVDQINGTYFQKGNSKVMTYQYYDVVRDKMETDRTVFELSNDTLMMDQGRKLLVRVPE